MLKLSATPTPHPAVTILPAPPALHRTNHGGNAWSTPDGATNLQPQDGLTHDLAIQRRYEKQMTEPKKKGVGTFSSVVTDPEDAQLTGGTRSLMRRLLGLNLRKSAEKVAAKLVAVKAA